MSNRQSLGRALNTWMQVVGIFAAATWGVYTFVHKEILLPRSAPVNITMDLELEEVGTRSQSGTNGMENLVAVAMSISAENPSPREVYLLPNAWVVYGRTVATDEEQYTPEDDMTISSVTLRDRYLETHSYLDTFSIVAAGGLFPDESLKPHERVERTIVFHVPTGRYDLIEVYTHMPTVAKAGVVGLEWKINSDFTLEPVMYHIGANGGRIPMEPDESGGYSDANLELQQANSQAQLSLWR